MKAAVVAWGNRRRSLRDEYHRILLVKAQADNLIEELRRRRDGEPMRAVDTRALREAITEVGAGADESPFYFDPKNIVERP